jgi:hypothetical protein
VIVFAVLLTALLSAAAGGFVVHLNQRRHYRLARQDGAYWRAAILRQCAGRFYREDR